MKKKYSPPNLIKAFSLSAAMATLLSSVSPVVASNLAITGDKTMSTSGSGVSYDHGSHGSIIFAGDDNYCGVDNVIGRGGKQQESIASTNQITAEQQYDRFTKNTNFSGRYPYGVTTDKVTWSGDSNTSNSSTGYMGKLTGGSTSAMPEAYGVYSFATGCGSAATGNYSTAFGAGATAKSGGAQAFGVSALANGAASVAIGIGSETVKRSSIAIGGLSKADGIDSIAFGSSAATGGQDAIAIGYAAKAGAQNAVSVGSSTKATGKSSLALGYKASASGELAVAIGGLATGIHGIAMGNNAEAKDQDTIAIGYAAQAQTKYSIAIGPNAQVIAGDGVALGGASVASVVNNVAGYDPVSNKNSQQNNGAWKSTKSAISVGKADGSITRQITGLAAGTADTDAVNVAQLKAMRAVVEGAGGWKLSVNGEAAVDILPGETVNFAGAELENYENKNIKIVRKDDKTVEFDLNDFITVGRVQAGKTQLSDLGFVITGGPRMTGSGIFAGNKQVYGVAAGSAETDAVNVAQLNEVKNQIAGNGLVKWDEEQKLITIGKEKDGTKIDVAGSGGDRSISGVKAAERDNEAVNKKQLDGEIATITDTINNIKEGGAFAVLYDKNGDSSVNYNGVTLGGGKTGGQVALHNVKDGEITEESYDAINGRQLWKTNERVTDVEKDIVHINDKVTNISATVTDLGKEVFNIQEANAFAVLYDKNADETVNYNSVTLGGGKSTGPVALLNVKDGKIAKDSHDAINGNQINTVSGDIAKFFGGGTVFQDGSFLGPRYNLSTVSADGTVGQKVHTDVGSALTGLDDNVNNVNSRLTHVANEFTQKIEGVSKDSLLWSNDEQAFVAQHGDGKTNSKIKFLANGDITENSTDAVNGSQLFATNQNVNTVTNNLATIAKNISKYFGGGADVSNGKAPTYTIQGKPHNDFESAFSTVDNSITNIQNQITNATKNSLVKQEENEGTITVGKATGGTKINVANKSGENRIISGVKAAVNGNEAVNKDQLDKSIEKISNDINLTSAAAVLYDKENGTVNYGSVTLGGVDNQVPVALHNVKDGKIAEDSHDAINGNQINKISGDIANYFGGGASFENGAFKGPNYSLSVIVEDGQVAKANYHDVGSALIGLDANVKSVNTHLTNVVKDVNEKITNITQEVKGDALLWSNDEQAFVALHGEGQKTNSKLTSLLNGDISEDSTDAVNGSQLYETNQKISKLGNGFDGISTNISKYFGGDTDIANGK
ncbi:hypothetical protein, partial [Bartonella sp. AP6QHHD]